jgi:hypothetical protein
MRWHDFELAAPQFARLAEDRLVGPGVVLVGTIRRDGTPRISPVEPFLLDGDLWLSMLWGSRKARDLERDTRVLLHSIVTSRNGGNGEVKVRGRCREQADPAVQHRYAEAVSVGLGWHPEIGRFHLFSVDIGSVAYPILPLRVRTFCSHLASVTTSSYSRGQEAQPVVSIPSLRDLRCPQGGMTRATQRQRRRPWDARRLGMYLGRLGVSLSEGNASITSRGGADDDGGGLETAPRSVSMTADYGSMPP